MNQSSSQRVILAVINDLVGDQRIHRIATTLAEAGYSVTVVGRVLPGSLAISDRPYATHRFRLPVHSGKFFYLLFNLRLFWWLLFQPVDIITSNDLDTLLACYFAARLRRKRLVYDSHELFTEVPELIDRPATRRIWLKLEQWLVPKLRKAYTVNESLARIFSDKYGVSFAAIRNVPFARPEPSGLDLPGKVILYQGALNLGRGIELMIDAMKHLPGYELWIIGRGDVEATLRKQASALPVGRVVFHGFMPLEQLHPFTAQASLGLSLEEDMGANYHFASPNKVYDYLQARIPVLVSDLPEMRAVVQTYRCGEILREAERNPEQLASRIRAILEKEDRWQNYREHARKAAAELTWEAERKKLLAVYRD